MATTLLSASLAGLESRIVEVEIEIVKNLSEFKIVGLPDATVSEAKERVRSAVKNSGAKFPPSKVIANLAPANVRKEGSLYDLPLALGVLAASRQVRINQDALYAGELALDGSLRPVPGVLSIALLARSSGKKCVYVPLKNAEEAALVPGIRVYGVSHLKELIKTSEDGDGVKAYETTRKKHSASSVADIDFSDIHGHVLPKLALEVAAAGSHNILLWGPPGSGKTMLARSIPSILPELSYEEALEVTQIYSVAGLLREGGSLQTMRPYRSPHHTASVGALVGGGRVPKPGEISLAHRGVLFLDEFAEFPRSVLENLRQPLEDKVITIARTQGTMTYPAQIMLVASLNPCPCGNAGSEKDCTCTMQQVLNYQKKLSGPLLDRFDLHVEVPRLHHHDIQERKGESSANVRKRVVMARKLQQEMLRGSGLQCIAEMNSKHVQEYCELTKDAKKLMLSVVDALALSGRGYYKIVKLGQTIAHLGGKQAITAEHISSALSFREKNIFE